MHLGDRPLGNRVDPDVDELQALVEARGLLQVTVQPIQALRHHEIELAGQRVG